MRKSELNRLFVVVLLLVISSVLNAKQWIDVTDKYIKNPRYDNNNYSFWQGTPLGGYNPFDNAEHYQKNYDTYQRLEGLIPGKYRVSLDAFYRMGGADNDYSLFQSGDYSDSQHAKLYAYSSLEDNEVSIVPVSSAALDYSLGGDVSAVGPATGWWGGRGAPYVPNNMEAAKYWFEEGYYENYVECEVGSDGILTIGIRKYTTVSGDWTCIDNWQLEYYGDVVKTTSIKLESSSLSMCVLEEKALSYTIEPSNATYNTLKWTTSNSRVVSVDDNGNLKALTAGTATITATAIDGSGLKATCRITVTKPVAPNASNIVINEIMSANVDVYRDPSTNYGSWVELYNPSSQGVNLGGLYISDDPNNLKKCKTVADYGVLPANGYAILNLDHHDVWTEKSYRQIPCKLDCDGGTIIISDGTTILAQQDYPEAISRTSYARMVDGQDSWSMTGNPSPGSSNAVAGGFSTEQLSAPVISRDGGLFTGTIDFNVEIPAGAILKYTTDGTAPSLTNGDVSEDGKFVVSSTMCYRFRLFQEGYLPSRVVTRSYIYDNGNEPFPIISIVMNKDDWDGSVNGIFSYSNMGRPGNGQSSNYNANMDWDRPVNFEYITDKNEYVLSQECDIATCGGWSRAWTPHSFKLKATKVYDLENTFGYQFFDEKPFLKHKTLQIRNGGNDNGPRIKDPSIQGIVASSGLKVEHQAWQPVHVYINGESYAVLNMREPNNKHYGYANHGIDTDEMDQFEMSPDSGYVQMEGTEDAYLRWYELSENASDMDVYEDICKLVDIDEYINYMAVELYVGNWDWPQNNVKGYRDVNDGKFRFVLFDLDGAFNTDTPFNTFFGKEYYGFDRLYGYDYSQDISINGTNRYQEIKFVTIFKNMLKNEEFKKKFVDTYCLTAGSVFEPNRVREIVENMASYLATGNYVSPWSTANDVISKFSSRQNTLVSHLQSYMGLTSSKKQNVKLSSDVEGAQLQVNGIEVPTGRFSGYLYGPVTYKASAPAGYQFVGWKSGSTSPTTDVSIINRGSKWSYADSDISSKNWKTSISAFTKSGNAPFGYGKNGIATNTAGNRLAYYFGKEVSLSSAPASTDRFVMNFTIDDGVVVYVNGVEAGRYNMPSGSVGDATPAYSYAVNNPDESSLELSASLFKSGKNYIAVEVHNNSTGSSDIYWDAQLVHTMADKSGEKYMSKEPEMLIESSGTYDLVACFEPIAESELIANGTTPIKINEISAGNTMYVNDYFKKDDWIELYNTTDKPIDVAGMYLTDNEAKPQKYQIPAGVVNTVIEPHGYLIVWASKRNTLTQLHASFKLDNADECKIVLTSEDGTWSDCLTYKAHTGMQSVGLYPDGSNNVYLMDVPTIHGINTVDSYATFLSYYVPGSTDDQDSDDIASVADAQVVSKTYYTVGGMQISEESARRSPGTYIVKHTLSDGRVVTKKVLLR